MTTRYPIRIILPAAAVVIMLLVLPATAKDIPKQLPDPDSKAPAANKPVKVYILSGQSNMV
ncbi:MAG: hypothetical protein QGH60_25140, partial [Phycisphaerae bacterium]|nr:hypothetical protein [Phycisphaerae bacterium]